MYVHRNKLALNNKDGLSQLYMQDETPWQISYIYF